MSCHSVRIALGCVIAALALSQAPAAEFIGKIPAAAGVAGTTQVSLADARLQIAKRTRVRRHFERDASAYWHSITEMRRVRATKRRNNDAILITDYVLTQPPLYENFASLDDPDDPDITASSSISIPVALDFLKSAAAHFDFAPLRPLHETHYKQTYAKIAAAGGLSQQQAVRVYAFESGGNATYEVQAGLEYPVPGARAISTALGYNQLLAANSVELLAHQGERIIEILARKSMELPEEARLSMESKIGVLKRMMAFARSVPDEWSDHVRLATTEKGLAIHAMNFDVDVGPVLQTFKLANSLNYARRKGYNDALSAAELEMMNLTGDGNGLDMVMIPASLRERVPTANFFQRGGYERNTIAVRNNVVAKLLAATDAKMDEEIKLQGASDLAWYFPISLIPSQPYY